MWAVFLAATAIVVALSTLVGVLIYVGKEHTILSKRTTESNRPPSTGTHIKSRKDHMDYVKELHRKNADAAATIARLETRLESRSHHKQSPEPPPLPPLTSPTKQKDKDLVKKSVWDNIGDDLDSYTQKLIPSVQTVALVSTQTEFVDTGEQILSEEAPVEQNYPVERNTFVEANYPSTERSPDEPSMHDEPSSPEDQISLDEDSRVTVTCVSYNVRCNKDPSPHSWTERCSPIVSALSECQPDLIALQEAREDYAHDIARVMGKSWRSTGYARRKGDEGTQILFDGDSLQYLNSTTYVLGDEGISPCPPSTHCTHKSVFNGTQCAHVRIFTHTSFMHREAGTIFHAMNTHFPLILREQMQCAELLAKFINQNIDADEAVLLCGDFNSHYAPSKAGTPLARLLELSPSIVDCHGMEDFPTYAEGFVVSDLTNCNSENHRLDYMLLRPGGGVSCVESQVIAARYVHESSEEVWRASDHEIMFARLVV